MKIAIDIDDTIAGSTESLRLLVNKRTSSDLPAEAYKIPGEYWGYYERVWEANGLGGKVDHGDFSAEMVVDQSHVPLLPGALFAINNLRKKHQIILVTARDESWESATKKWLGLRFGASENIEVYFTKSHHDAAAETKGQLCRRLGVSLLIDDNIEHCLSAVNAGVEAILFGEYGWHMDVPSELVRCKSWEAVLAYLNE